MPCLASQFAPASSYAGHYFFGPLLVTSLVLSLVATACLLTDLNCGCCRAALDWCAMDI
jgi:hypothetical protein